MSNVRTTLKSILKHISEGPEEYEALHDDLDEEDEEETYVGAAVPDEPVRKRHFNFSSKEGGSVSSSSTSPTTFAAASRDERPNVVPFARGSSSSAVAIVQASPDQDIASLVRKAADQLSQRNMVVLNLQYSSKENARRILDYLGGVSYALRASIKPIAISAYILAPSNYSLDDTDRVMEELETGDLL